MTRGVRQIVRFNWPFYAAGAGTIAVATWLAVTWPLPTGVRALLVGATGAAGFWLAASLAASWIVYDRSPLMRWDWVLPAIGCRPNVWINIHTGLDQSTPALRRRLPEPGGRVFDIYDRLEMGEPSIARARRFAPVTGDAVRVDFRHLPAAASTVDAALLLLSAHEVRSDEARRALFGEIHRVLAPNGRAVVAEHLRDWANCAAFGPGCLHFHSRRTWLRCFDQARLAIHAEFSITPFVRVFVLRRLA